MDFEKICRERFSVRSFSDRKVGRETVGEILALVRQAPTALNQQPYRVLVADGDEALQKLQSAKTTLYGAGTVLILCSDRSRAWANRYSGETDVLIDMGILTATALYAATEYGVDSCCVCNFDPAAVKRAFDMPDHLVPDALILLGYRTADARPSERHTMRRPVGEFTDWLSSDGCGHAASCPNSGEQ